MLSNELDLAKEHASDTKFRYVCACQTNKGPHVGAAAVAVKTLKLPPFDLQLKLTKISALLAIHRPGLVPGQT